MVTIRPNITFFHGRVGPFGRWLRVGEDIQVTDQDLNELETCLLEGRVALVGSDPRKKAFLGPFSITQRTVIPNLFDGVAGRWTPVQGNFSSIDTVAGAGSATSAFEAIANVPILANPAYGIECRTRFVTPFNPGYAGFAFDLGSPIRLLCILEHVATPPVGWEVRARLGTQIGTAAPTFVGTPVVIGAPEAFLRVYYERNTFIFSVNQQSVGTHSFIRPTGFVETARLLAIGTGAIVVPATTPPPVNAGYNAHRFWAIDNTVPAPATPLRGALLFSSHFDRGDELLVCGVTGAGALEWRRVTLGAL